MSRVSEKIILTALPKLLLGVMKSYLRLEIEGLENLPRRGKTLVIANHSGCTGLDALMLAYILNLELNRIPRILALWNIFQWAPSLEKIAKKMGLKEARAKAGIDLLKKNHLIVIFPEGVNGSFKSSTQKYRLQSFDPGFMRLSHITDAPIIPTVIIGAEESNINIGKVQFKRLLNGLTLPLPLNVFPLPAKWKIRFLKPVYPSDFDIKNKNDKPKIEESTITVKNLMQSAIDAELKSRPYIFFQLSKSELTSTLNRSA
jgi:1-acyl-sn-glycerol-3-phosphate acyltransferase